MCYKLAEGFQIKFGLLLTILVCDIFMSKQGIYGSLSCDILIESKIIVDIVTQ